MKKILKMLFNRVVLVGLAILVQVLLLILMVVKFQEYFVYFYAMCTVLSMAVAGRWNCFKKVSLWAMAC